MVPERVCAVVDAFSTGVHLAPEFGRLGVACVHVQSRPDLPGRFRGKLRRQDFVDAVVHRGDLDATARRLARHPLLCVIPGTELGVELADALAERLDLPRNDFGLSRARRDKHEMALALGRSGVRHAAHLLTGDVAEALAWAVRRGEWPVVVKPADSAGSDGVTICGDDRELAAAFARVHGTMNGLGRLNARLVVQEFLAGDQYLVNTVSCAGRHRVVDIWRDHRVRVAGAGSVTDREELVPASGPVQDALVRYVLTVLDALGLRWGPAHSELMLTASGPVLIETAARLQGLIHPGAVTRAIGHDQVGLTCRAYARPAAFLTDVDERYRVRVPALFVALIAEREGRVETGVGLERIRDLPTFAALVGGRSPGEEVRRTVDLYTAPGFAYLVGDLEQLERDYRQVRAWEAEGLYGVVAGR